MKFYRHTNDCEYKDEDEDDDPTACDGCEAECTEIELAAALAQGYQLACRQCDILIDDTGEDADGNAVELAPVEYFGDVFCTAKCLEDYKNELAKEKTTRAELRERILRAWPDADIRSVDTYRGNGRALAILKNGAIANIYAGQVMVTASWDTMCYGEPFAHLSRDDMDAKLLDRIRELLPGIHAQWEATDPHKETRHGAS